MASRTLYPPIVSESQPAFVAGPSSQLKVYFSLSALSSTVNTMNLTVHASIMRKDGVKVLNTENDKQNNRYRATGIILNLVPQKDPLKGDNCYYVTINNSDIKSIATLSGTTYKGWIPGWTYKIQLRLSEEQYPGGDERQAAWLQEHSYSFSEWSTVCYVKAIAEMGLQIPMFDFDSSDKTREYKSNTVYMVTNVDFFGSISSTVMESNESFETVNVSLYKDDKRLEQSGDIFRSELSESYFKYRFKTNFENDTLYKILLTYKTENGYIPDNPYQFLFQVKEEMLDPIDAQLITIETDINDTMKELTSLEDEEEEGRIGLKMFSYSTSGFGGNICIRRASAADNFATWEDIKIFTVRSSHLNDYPIFYDYTIESGVWYKYSIQSISKDGQRSVPVIMSVPVQRIFNQSYLLGQEEQQLKICFNSTVSSYKIQKIENKVETLAGKYPFISRNAEVGYKTFPIGGLISFWEDEAQTFLKNGKIDIYQYPSVVEAYENDNRNRDIVQYDFTFERDFRNKVLEFLYDGKPKLFKSATEGNVVVRLMDVNCTPNQQLGRMIYSFTATAYEIDEPTMENYLKYGFYNPGTYATEFSTYSTYLGQLDGTFSVNDNILNLIYEKYNVQKKDYGALTEKFENVSHIRITINEDQLRIRNNSGELTLGHNIKLVSNGNVSTITIYNPDGIYEFDSLINFQCHGGVGSNALYLLGDAEGLVTQIPATIDFLYSLSLEPKTEQIVSERKGIEGIGQFCEHVEPGVSIYNSIYYKYNFKTATKRTYLSYLSSIEIEANPHTVFEIKDYSDEGIQYHEVGDSGVLVLNNLTQITNLVYCGKRYPTIPYNDSSISDEIITQDIESQDVYGNPITIRASADVTVTYFYKLIEETLRN